MRTLLLKPITIKLAEVQAGTRTKHFTIPAGKWSYWEIDDLDLTVPILEQYKANFDGNVLGLVDNDGAVQIPLDVSHVEGVEGAPGWIRALELSDEGLTLEIEWTDLGIDLVSKKRFQYISPELKERWIHPMTKIAYDYVMVAAALTNQPFLKGQPALELSAQTKHGRMVFLKDKPGIPAGREGDDEMRIEEVTQAVVDANKPVLERLDRVETQMSQHQAFLTEQSQARANADRAQKRDSIKATILGWRFGDKSDQQIAPAVAQSFADAFVLMVDADREAQLVSLKANPPQLVPLGTESFQSDGTGSKLTEAHRLVAQQIGLKEDVLEKHLAARAARRES